MPPEGSITITMPDAFHHRFCDGAKTKSVLDQATHQRFSQCIAMPNLKPLVTNTALAGN